LGCSEELDVTKAIILFCYTDIELSISSLARLRPSCWLNDDVIDVYTGIIQQKYNNIYIPLTQFQKDVNLDGDVNVPKAVRVINKENVTTNRNVYNCEKWMIPINVNDDHWTLLVLNMQTCEIQYFDSLNHNISLALETGVITLMQGLDIPGEWKTIPIEEQLPQQDNTDDCGVFMITFAERLARGAPMNFSQDNILHIRELITNSIK
jgi:sentrin-specific protease 1